MEPMSRRNFFKGAGAAAAVAGVAATVPLGAGGIAGAATTPREPALAPNEDIARGEHLIAQVTNARTGEISVFLGEREVTFHDRHVAARLVRAAR
jgi:hypothetical protein